MYCLVDVPYDVVVLARAVAEAKLTTNIIAKTRSNILRLILMPPKKL